jgi:hypothetical protein
MHVSANKHIELIMLQINIKYQSNLVVTVAVAGAHSQPVTSFDILGSDETHFSIGQLKRK